MTDLDSNPRLSIPSHAALVLPDGDLSVPDLLRYKLLNPLRTIYRSELVPWSTSPAGPIDPTILRNHIMPPKEVLDHLLSEVAHLAPTVRSVQRAAILPDSTLPGNLPIWILSFWAKSYEARWWRGQWKVCNDWVASRPHVSAGLRDQLDKTLINIHWRGSLDGRRRDRSISDIFDLLSNNELNSGQIDDLLELIERDLPTQSPRGAASPLVASTVLAQTLVFAHQQRDSNDFRKTWFQATVEKSLVEKRKSSVAGVAWISRSGHGHWVSYVVNPASSLISYGDSLGGSIPLALSAALQWWLLNLREMMGLSIDDTVTVVPLPITPQDDGFSCGILSTNSIGYHLTHDTFPLVGRDPVSIKTYRIKRTIDILMLDGEFADGTEAAEPLKLSFHPYPPSHFSLTPSPPLHFSRPLPPTSSPPPPTSSPPLPTSSPPPPVSSPPPRSTYPSPCPPPPSPIPLDSTVPDHVVSLVPEKQKRIECADVPKSPKQKTINEFFVKKLSADEGLKQAQQRLMRTAEERGDWLDEEELRRKRVKVARRDANTRSQQESRARRRVKEIADGVRDASGKIKKVSTPRPFHPAEVTIMIEASRPKQSIIADHVSKSKGPAGAKKKNGPLAPHKNMNWFFPSVWAQIVNACRHVGYPYDVKAIIQRLQAQNPAQFNTLRHQRFSEWIDRTHPDRHLHFKPEVQHRVNSRQAIQPAGHVSRVSILEPYPEVVNVILKQLRGIREASVPLDLITIRGLMIGILQVQLPNVFTVTVGNDSKHFQCSDSFVGRFVKEKLGWSRRKGTQAGQKLPADAEDQMEACALRLAVAIADHDIPETCIVSGDQTGNTFAQSSQSTYAETGTNQVTIVGKEDKRAFTIMVGISMGGDVLPFQVIYGGHTDGSLPKLNEPGSAYKSANDEAKRLKFRFEPGGKKHWSNISTMKSYVTEILAVYFNDQRTRLGRPNQRCLWLIDCWSVHRSQEFRDWMRDNYPWIFVRYIPGGCTGIFQPCDVGIQRILKHAMRKAALSHVVKETVAHLSNNTDPGTIVLEKGIRELRRRSVEWLVDGYNAINNRDFVKKAWRLCSVKSLNLSYECLTSAEVRQVIIGLRLSNPRLYKEITEPPASTISVPPPVTGDNYPEDREDANEDNGPFFDGAMSVEDAISQILDLPNTQVPIDAYDSDDEEVEGYDCPDL